VDAQRVQLVPRTTRSVSTRTSLLLRLQNRYANDHSLANICAYPANIGYSGSEDQEGETWTRQGASYRSRCSCKLPHHIHSSHFHTPQLDASILPPTWSNFQLTWHRISRVVLKVPLTPRKESMFPKVSSTPALVLASWSTRSSGRVIVLMTLPGSLLRTSAKQESWSTTSMRPSQLSQELPVPNLPVVVANQVRPRLPAKLEALVRCAPGDWSWLYDMVRSVDLLLRMVMALHGKMDWSVDKVDGPGKRMYHMRSVASLSHSVSLCKPSWIRGIMKSPNKNFQIKTYCDFNRVNNRPVWSVKIVKSNVKSCWKDNSHESTIVLVVVFKKHASKI